jgi:hypothetical protein
MSCKLQYKLSSENSRAKLIEEGILNEHGNRIISSLSKFDSTLQAMQRSAYLNYDVNEPLYTREQRGEEHYAQGNLQTFEAIDAKRKELGIFESQESIGSFNKRLVDELYQEENYQLQGTESSKASPKTLEKVKEFLKRNNIEIKDLDSRYEGINGVAKLLENVIGLAQGKENVALTEEAMHFAVEMLEKSNPTLFKSMLNKIGNYTLYKKVLDEYGQDKAYQIDGKPNILKIKKEVIGKVLAEYVIKEQEGDTEKPELLQQTKGWWETIKSILLGFIRKAQFNPFEEAAKNLGTLQGDTAKDLADRINPETLGKGIFSSIIKNALKEGNYIEALKMLKDQLSDPRSYPQTLESLGGNAQLAQDIINSEFFSKNKEVDDLYNKYIEEDRNLILIPESKDDKRHYTYKGERVARSVTEKIKYLDKNFGEQSEEEKARTSQLADWGTAGHAFIQDEINTNLIDAEGYKKPFTDETINTTLNKGVQDKLREYIRELINSYPEGTRFLVEKKVINTKDKGYTASTVDFKAIIPGENGTIQRVDTLDWKFFNLNKDRFKDIPWYKDQKWKAQMAEFNVIDKQYGLKTAQQGKSRMVPFISNYVYNKKGDAKSGLKLDSIEIGNVNTAKETKLYLLPVPVETESTGNKLVDELVTKLRAQYKKLYDRPVDEKVKGEKFEQLDQLSEAIRRLQLQLNFDPLQKEARTFLGSAKKVLDKYKDINFSILEKNTLNAVGKELLELEESANIYSDINETYLSQFPREKQTPDEKKKFTFFETLSQSTERLIESIRATQLKLAAGLAVQENILNTQDVNEAEEKLITPEKEITNFADAYFGEGSKLPSRVIKLAKKLWINKKSEQYQMEKALGNEFASLLPDFFSATKSFKNALDAIKQKGSHRLIFKTSREFTENIKKAQVDKDKKFLLANVNLEEYKAAIKAKVEATTDNILNSTYNDDPELNDREQQLRIKNLKNSLELDSPTFNGWQNRSFQYFYRLYSKKDSYLSEEYKEMQKTPAILKVWEFYTKLNEIGKEIGYTNSSAFLPFIEGTIVEQMRQSNNVAKTAQELLKQGYVLNINEKASHVKINKQTGEVEKGIARLFTRESENIEPTAYSQDVTKITGPWINALLGYKAASEMEYILLTLLEVEQSKGHLQVDANNKVIFENDAPKQFEGNEKNTQILQKIIDDDIYHTQENSNTFIDIATDKLSKGTEEEKTTKKLQTKKIVQNANKWTSMLATGAKLMVSIPNTVGEEFQALINAGTFYKGKEYLKNSSLIIGSGGKYLSTIDKGLIDIIHPLTEDTALENTRKFAKKESKLSYLSTWSINDAMHAGNSVGSLVHEYANAKTFNDNSIVRDGKIINIRQYLQREDAKKYKLSQGERKELEKTFESRVQELKKENLPSIAKFEEGKLVIPGVSQEELARYRTQVAEYARNISGKVSRDNKAEWNRSVIAKSFMMFKGWIPKQLDLRGSDIRKNNELDSWEYGRTRLFIKTWSHLGLTRILDMKEIIQGTDRGLEIMKEILDDKREKYYLATGQQLEITDEEFFDLMRKELYSQSKELTMLLGVLSLFVASRMAKPDKDDDELTQNRYKWWRKLLNKISNELDFYYNPASADSITRGSIIPSLSILNKMEKFIKSLEEETRGHIIDDQELIDKNYPTKYFLNLIPGPAQFTNEVLPIFFPQEAKDLGIRVSEVPRANN